MGLNNRQNIDGTLVDAAMALLKASGYFVDNLWHTQDIQLICEQYNLPILSNAEAMQIFAIADEHFDGEEGMSWPGLDRAVFMYFGKAGKRRPVAVPQKELEETD